ncbi:unnamed protein product [Ilex paraguariensis]|uniref:STML2-like C-terminal extension domain-containing protein n=1 Tax=Ilex paraguariensis TaxID=185542 RepID=A0ABC8RHT8_9AQUA
MTMNSDQKPKKILHHQKSRIQKLKLVGKIGVTGDDKGGQSTECPTVRERQTNINIAHGRKISVILASEAAKMDQINRAQGEAEAILAIAQATSKGIAMVSQTLKEHGSMEAACLRIAEQYIQAFSKIAEKGTILLPTSASDLASTIAQVVSIYKFSGRTQKKIPQPEKKIPQPEVALLEIGSIKVDSDTKNKTPQPLKEDKSKVDSQPEVKSKVDSPSYDKTRQLVKELTQILVNLLFPEMESNEVTNEEPLDASHELNGEKPERGE